MQSDNDEALNDILAKKFQQLSYDVSNDKSSGENSRTTLAAPLILNDLNFAHAVEKYHLLVVDFWAPCVRTMPYIESNYRAACKGVCWKGNIWKIKRR